jgi:hypothetical protein
MASIMVDFQQYLNDLMNLKVFVSQWNTIISELNEPLFILTINKGKGTGSIIPDLINRTNISQIPIGGINFGSEITEYEGRKLQFGFYDECDAILWNKETNEILAIDNRKEDSFVFMSAAQNPEAFVESLLLYIKISIDYSLHKRKPDEKIYKALVSSVGGKGHMNLYNYLLRQLES